MTRNHFLRFMGAVLLALLSGPVRLFADMVPRVMRKSGKTLPITPTPQFYIEDISGPPETLTQSFDHWQLKVTGRVDRPFQLSYQEILSRPTVRQIITLSCIGNPVGGHAIGNAEWTGLPLKTLIKEADPHFFSNHLILKAEDGYQDSIPLSKASHPGAMLAHTMNGKPLTPDHGFPLRMLVPGLYGIKQVKWIKEIEVSNEQGQGYWQKRGWTKDARVKIFSRIDLPENDAWLTGRRLTIRGVAFAGDRGIQYVQVSTDREKTWSLARLEEPLSPYSWVLWSFPVTFPGSGRYPIAVRAADQYSGVQADDLRDPFPSGTSGIHRITVNVM